MRFMYDVPRVGVAVIVRRDDKILMGKRKGSHAEGSWAFPGGKLDLWEELESCARREVLEETGLSIENVRIGPVTNDMFRKDGRHFITVFAISDSAEGAPKNMEPEKCGGWEWFEWNRLPKPLMLPIENLIKNGFNPFD